MLDKSKICVVIPCYNNEKTVADVALSVTQYSENVVVVLDGCTDKSAANLQKIADKITILSYSPNKGKGAALNLAFDYANNHNFDYAISIDADGQHFASDLPLFLETIDNNYGAMVESAPLPSLSTVVPPPFDTIAT